MGVHQALMNMRAASRGEMFWEERIVDGHPTRVLDATTDVKHGLIDDRGMFVTEDGGELMRTGQILSPRMMKIIRPHISKGLKKSGFDLSH